MQKLYFVLLPIFLFSINDVIAQKYKLLGSSQESREARVRFEKPVKLNWTLPSNSSPVFQEETSFNLALEIESSFEISSRNITLYVDGKNIKSKAGEVDLSKKRSSNKYIFEYTLNQKADKEKTKIDVSVDVNGTIHKSSTMEVRHRIGDQKSNLHLVSIGIGKYSMDSEMQNLSYPEKDAKTFYDLFNDQSDLLFNSVIRYPLLKGERALTGNIIAQMNQLKQLYLDGDISSQDLILIYISSHGIIHENDFKIVPHDFRSSVVERTTVSYKRDIINVLKEVNCKKLVFLDACHSGGAKAGSKDFNADLAEAIQKLVSTNAGVTTITSSSENELSYELEAYQHGSFTQALKEAFSGKANKNRDNYLDLDEIFNYIEKRVPQLNKEEGKDVQTPSRSDNQLGALPIYILK